MSLSTIQATLGLDTSSFSTKAKAAEKDLKQVAEGVQNIGKVFSAGGTITAVMSFFNGVIAAARDSKDNIDANVQAVRRFGDSFDQAKSWATGFSLAVVGSLNRVGEAYGSAAKQTWAFVTGRSAQQKAEEEVLAATEAAAAASEARLAEAMKHQKEYLAVTQGLAKVEADRAAARAKSLTDEEKLAAFQNAAASAADRANDATLTTLERRQALLEQRRAELGIEEAQAVLQTKAEAQRAKDQAEADKKTAAAAAERLKTQELLAEYAKEDEKTRIRALGFEVQLATLVKERADLQKTQVDQTITEEKRRETIIRQRELEKEIATLVADENERSAEAAEKEKKTREEIFKIQTRISKFSIVGENYRDQSTDNLEDVRRKLSKTLSDQIILEQKAVSPGAVFAAESLVNFTRQQLSQIEAELSARSRFDTRVNSFGENTARQFTGSEEFDRLKELVTPSPDSKRAADSLAAIDRRLRRAGFREE